MSENAKKMLSLLMAVCMLFSMMPVGASAQETGAQEQTMTEPVVPEATVPGMPEVLPTVPPAPMPDPSMPPAPTMPETTGPFEDIPEGTYPEGSVPADTGELFLGENWATISYCDGRADLTFVPEQSGKYLFYAACKEDTYATLYDADWNWLAENDDGGEGWNFLISAELTAGETYILQARYLSSWNTGSFPVIVEKNLLQSIEFAPITVYEGTKGYISSGWDDETQQERAYYYYNFWEMMPKSTYTATFEDGTVLTGSGTSLTYNGRQYSFDENNTDPQDYANRWTVGNTYHIGICVMGIEVSVPVTIVKAPLESATFTPVSVTENTHGGWNNGWDEETQQEYEYYYYEPLSLIAKSTYTFTFTDGTVITGTDRWFTYNGEQYEMAVFAPQSYEGRWTLGNTYYMSVSVMGQEIQIPVTITTVPLESLTFTPVTIPENSYGEFVTEGDGEYYRYNVWNFNSWSTFTATFTDGTVLSSNERGFYYEDEWYSFDYVSYQSAQSPWLAGNTYCVDVTVGGVIAELYVTIEASPLQSIVYEPVTIIENTHGYMNTAWNPETGNYDQEYFRYYIWESLQTVEYTATFIDGTTQTQSGNAGVYYNGQWYNPTCNDPQDNGERWTVGNTYYVEINVMGQRAQVPITIIPSPLQSITFTPVTVIEGTRGHVNTEWNPETGNYDLEYFYYEPWDVMSKSRYTATFADGSVREGQGNSSVYYDGEWYGFSIDYLQNYEYRWTVGNTYYVTLSVMGQNVEVPITIVPSPVVSIAAEPITVIEGKGGHLNNYWPGDGTMQSYYTYSWWNKLNYTVTFNDGTTITCENGNGFDYQGEWYSVQTSDNQGYENQWTVGNTYTATASVMGVSTEVSVTVIDTPIASVTFDPVMLEEYKNGYWSGHYGETGYTEYFKYYWYHNLTYTVTFKDGTVKQGTYWNDVEYDGEWYGIESREDNQSQNPWQVNNTYTAQVTFAGKAYDVYITIAKNTEDNGYIYMAQGGVAIINGCTLQTEILQIPETIDGYPVVGITSLGDAIGYATEIRIPNSVTMLSYSTFSLSSNYTATIPLKKLSLGSGIADLDMTMLRQAKNLEQIVVAAGNPYLCSIDGVVYDKAVTTILAYPPAKQNLHIVPDSVTNVELLFDGEHSELFTNVNIQFGAGVEGYKMVDGIIYNEDMTVVLKATAAATGSYVMPDSVEHIKSYAFTGSKLESVTISPNVTSLVYCEFYYSTELKEIGIPESLRSIEFKVFQGCENLEKVHITDLASWCSIDHWGYTNNPLYQAHNLYLNGQLVKDLVIPETVVERIYPAVFAGGSFESVTVPASVKEIGYNAFKDCENLERVNISDLSAWCETYFDGGSANPLYYAHDLYLNGEKITELTIPEDVNVVAPNAFYNGSMTSLTVTSHVYIIGSNAFCGSAVEKIVLEEGVTSIEYSAFQNSALKSVELPDSLTYLGSNAFTGCQELEYVDLGNTLNVIPYRCFYNTGLKTVTLPKQIALVESGAFENADLTEVIFDCDNVEIGWSAFKNCPLGDLELGENIQYISDEAFSGTNATQIKHPASVTEISYRTYAFNKNLVSITIPDSVEYISWAAFDGDTNLSHVLYTGTEEQWQNLEAYSDELNNATIHFEATGNEVTTEQTCTTVRFFCTICDKWETVLKGDATHTFVDEVCTVCGHEGFWEYEIDEVAGTVTVTGYIGQDTDVILPEKIEGLPVVTFTPETFSYNRKLTSVVLPKSITQIPDRAFEECVSLNTVVLEGNVTSIGSHAFNNDYRLTTIDLPDSLTDIGDAAFCGCRDLSVSIPKSVRTIGAMAFFNCSELERVEIPAGVTEISYEAFSACWNLEEVVIPDTVTTIGYYAFSGASITELTIPASVKEICPNAFYENAIETLVFEGDRPNMDYAFDQSGITVFYAASNKSWKNLPDDSNSWYACRIPVITEQPVSPVVQPGEKITLSAAGYGQRLSYQWYYAEPGAKKFTPVGGNSVEFTVVVDRETVGARAYCVVTDILGQTAKTDTVTLKNPANPTGIKLNQLPYTLEYDLRQELRIRGLEVVLTYDDNSQEAVLDYEVSGFDPNMGGVQTVTVTYGNYTATFNVTVNEEKLNFSNEEEKIELSAPEGAVEQDTQLVVEKLDQEEQLPVLPEIPEILQENESVIFDITLEKEGETVQPAQTVQVSIPVPEHMESKRCKVYHIGDDGSATDMNAWYKDGRLVFDTDHFSYYAVVEVTGVTVSGTVTGSGDVTGTVVKLLSGGEVLETVSVSKNGTYLFENVVGNDYVIEAFQEGLPAKQNSITVADRDLILDILLAILGDIDGNGDVTTEDVIQLLLHVTMPDMFAIDAIGDFTGDGNITTEDVIQLLLHVTMPDMFPL